MKIPSYLVLCGIFPASIAGLWLLYTWLPNFLYERFSLSLAKAGFIATVYLQTATLVGLLLGGLTADWLYKRTPATRFWLVASGALVSGPCLHLVGSAPSLLLTEIAAMGFGLASGLLIANLMIASFDVVPVDTRASAVGFLNFIGSIISGIAAMLAGIWKGSVGVDKVFSYCALACFGAALLMIAGIKAWFRADYQRVH